MPKHEEYETKRYKLILDFFELTQIETDDGDSGEYETFCPWVLRVIRKNDKTKRTYRYKTKNNAIKAVTEFMRGGREI